MAEHTAWLLAADGLFVEPVLDTYRMHSAEVGRMVVRAGQHETPAELLVLVQQCEDVDGTAGGSTGPLVCMSRSGGTEDFTLDEAEQLARLLRAARDLGRNVTTSSSLARRPTTAERVLTLLAQQGGAEGLTRADIARALCRCRSGRWIGRSLPC